MGTRLKKICIGTCIFYMLSSGCATTTRIANYPSRVETIVSRYAQTSNVKLINPALDKDSINIDDLINTSDEYIEYLTFRKKYSNDANQIVTNLENNNFSTADNLVKKLAAKLEKDQSPYAKRFLKDVKSFEYYRVDYIDYAYKTEYPREGILQGIAMAPFSLFLALMPLKDPSYTTHYLKEPFETAKREKTVKLETPYYKKVLVKPYYGTETVVEENILKK